MPSRQEVDQLAAAGRLYQAGDLDGAERACEKLVRKNKNFADAHQLLGLIASRRRKYEEAIACYARCTKLSPDNPRFAYLAAKAHTALGRIDEAIKWYDRALELEPENAETLGWKALALERAGRADEALAIVERYVSGGEETVEMAEAYARARQRAKDYDETIRIARKHADDAGTHRLNRWVLAFLAAKSLEKAQRYDEAFEAYARANRILAQPFDRAAFAAHIDAQIETFSPASLADLPRANSKATRPVFIVGMPRSGTTLIEQIIDAHPKAQGVGELTDIEDLAADLPRRCPGKEPYPACLRRATPRLLTDAGNDYLRRLHKLAEGAARAVNKSLFNWQHLGLLSLLFPHGYFIDCRRDPVDNCASCFMSELMPGKMPYSTDLADLAFAYRQYERLMAHWHEVLDVKMLRVRYEDVVADLPGQAREIIAFLDLAWDERCERFHESGRTAMTLSYDQVQQPIYASSVGRAERFGAHLEPLRRALAADAAS